MTPSDRRRHRFAVFLSCCVLGLISAGAFVTSKEAGLSVPDWPLSYGSLNPPRWWEISNVRAEHGHRLIAGTVALLTVGLAVWTGLRERRHWVRRLSYVAVAAVFAQALLGGLTVLFFLPTPISVSHAGLAELFFCLIVTLAVVTSRWWERERRPTPDWLGVRTAATLTSVLVFSQILVGAVMRHSGAGLAIPDFPLAFGRLIPPRFDFPIGIHFTHRLGALVVTVAIVWLFIQVRRTKLSERLVTVPVTVLLGLVTLQVGLGAVVVLTGKAVVPNTIHVATGASILATSVIATLAGWRLVGRSESTAPSSARVEWQGAES
ncbi:MAG: COX15/CtaA family protein [Acidobacteriota bacterium]|nr:COX15/CtaA family protein [Acidobacteriota bacterium]